MQTCGCVSNNGRITCCCCFTMLLFVVVLIVLSFDRRFDVVLCLVFVVQVLIDDSLFCLFYVLIDHFAGAIQWGRGRE
jgi:hypothetical protein